MRALAVVVAVALSGCWLQVGGAPGNTRFNGIESGLTVANVASLAEAWSVDHGGSGGTTEPIVSGNRVYVTRIAWAGVDTVDVLAVEARDIGTGDLVWQRSLIPPGFASWGSASQVTLIDDALWVASRIDGTPECTSTLTRLDPATGAVLSSEQVDEMGSYPVGDGGIVAHLGPAPGCGGALSRSLVVRDAATRAVRWTATFPGLGALSEPMIADGRVYVTAGGSLYAFAAEGCGASMCVPLWQADGAPGSLTGRPVAGPAGEVLVVHDEPGTGEGVSLASVRAYAGATGVLLWQTATGDPTRPTAIEGIAVGDDQVYVPVIHEPSDPSTELAVYPAAGCGGPTCAPSWTASLGPGATFRPTVGGGVVYVTLHIGGGTSSALVAVSAAGCGAPTCSELVRLSRSGWMTSPSLAAGRLFVSAEHDLVAFASSG